MLKLSPSVLAADFSDLRSEIQKVESAECDMLHLDVMDGMFVPNISFGMPVIAALRPHSKLLFDVHLMIEDPIRYIKDFVKAGADSITFHYESCNDQKAVIEEIRKYGVRVGISIKPQTPAFVLEPLLPSVDMVLVMTVEPGFGGQDFIAEVLPKVRRARELVDTGHLTLLVEVDGGINADTIEQAAAAGADVFVAGSAVYGAEDPAAAISALRAKAAASR